MGRHRSRSRSYTPTHRHRSPPRRKHYDEPRRSSYSRSERRRSPAPSGLLVRNIALNTRPEDLRTPFEKFGPVKDIYLPRNYYTGEPRGFGFVKFRYPEDAAEAKDRLNHTILGGREIRIVYAEENRKTPQEMRKITRPSRRYEGRRTSPRSPRRRHRSYSRSPSSGRHYSRSVSRSRSPRGKRDYRSSQRSLSPRAFSPDGRGFKEWSPSPRDISPHDMKYKSRRSYSPRANSPDERENRGRARSRSPRDISPDDVDYKARRSHTPRASSPDGRGNRASERSHGAEYKSRRSYSPRDIPSHDDQYKSVRSHSSREISPHDRKDLKSSQRSVSPRKESLGSMEHPKQETPMSRDVSPRHHDDRSNKRSPGTRVFAKDRSRRGTSPGDTRVSGYEENGESPLHSRNLFSSPGKKDKSISRSRSRSYSPR